MYKSKKKVVAFKRFIAIPFKNLGREYEGCDCWGLIKLIMKDYYGVDVPDYHISCMDYKKIDNQIDQDRAQWKRIDTPVEPCLVLFKLHNRIASICNHIGLYIGNNEFIHTLKQYGATINRLDHPYFKAKLEGFYVLNC